ncbi:ATP-dependent endonuclease [Bacillus pseudomycoides]|uniref:ATP-dependent nuclease n=1 Tax=Bacillus pseudomycoides TaxID=64104 RepID=UPI000BF30A9F|nr:AAA family ATPase [Bacillus pseudomycoides]PGE93299.1 ATP-dependent endonuclease [Bacillus pseudomycoides]
MYISELKITSFRGFTSEATTIEFKEGINVIIGQNNAGKTTIIKALEILFDNKFTKKLSINDFNRNIEMEKLKSNPPKICISAKLLESDNEEPYSDELVTVANWLTNIGTPFEATITFEFFLPENDVDAYKKLMDSMKSTDINDYWKVIEQHFLKKYVSRTYVGNPNLKNQVNSSELSRFDFQFLSAIRDVERDLFKGNNTLLKEVIDFYMDYDIKNNKSLDINEKLDEIQSKKDRFAQDSKQLLKSLKDRMSQGEEQILKYVKSTGAGVDNSKPIFEGEILDTELYSALRLIVEKETGIKLPATSNGLGYNNLIYISLLLSKMQKDSSGEYLGSNSKIFSILAIEEPEAHLHPSMQYKFLQFLKRNKESEVRQVFITSHSPNITAAVDLEDIIVLQKLHIESTTGESKEIIRAAYPDKVFEVNKGTEQSKEDKKSKDYVKRFLDVTKADLFFAQNIILVEGIAEQLVVPEFARKLDLHLEDSHTTVINIGGSYFDHFLKLFDTCKSPYAINKKIACITDLDPVRKKITVGSIDGIQDETEDATEDDSSNWEKCHPIFLRSNTDLFEYKDSSNKLITNRAGYSSNIKIFTQPIGLSSTFEYELVRKNPTNNTLVTSSMSNQKELMGLFHMINQDKTLEDIIKRIRTSKFKTELLTLLQSGVLEDHKDKKVALLASRYLLSVKKGEAAQEIAYLISKDEEDLISPPDYISEAIRWISL